MNKIAWVSAGLKSGMLDELSDVHSTVASYRYRMFVPSKMLIKNYGYGFCIQNPLDYLDTGKLYDPEVAFYVFAKFNDPNPIIFNKYAKKILIFAGKIKEQKQRIFVDLCDNLFLEKESKEFYSRLIDFADLVIVNTPEMAKIVKQYTSKSAIIIQDPISGEKTPASFAPKINRGVTGWLRQILPKTAPSRLRLLWFGHPTNLPTLQRYLPTLTTLSKDIPITLRIVTTPGSGVDQLLSSVIPPLTVEFLTWSVEGMSSVFADSDIVIIPSEIDDPRKIVKSSNRLAEAVWAGKYVVAHPLPAYLPFRETMWISEDLVTGIKWALSHPREVEEQISRAQKMIEETLTPEIIAMEWHNKVFQESLPQVLHHEQNMQDVNRVRLNLGCGDKILPGYVNVDVAASRMGAKPDVLCDLRDLSRHFSTGSVDEVLSVHVVEHFWRWEVMEVLQEWVRVLRPGGKMILECPNLLSACTELVNNPHSAEGMGIEGQKTMWVLYGDPRWRDPLMVHRWGYTPETLSKLLEEVGLVEVRQEPAQFKLREPRDMRIVGIKPH